MQFGKKKKRKIKTLKCLQPRCRKCDMIITDVNSVYKETQLGTDDNT